MTYSLKSKMESSGSTTVTMESKAGILLLSPSIMCSNQRLSLISPVLNLSKVMSDVTIQNDTRH